MATVTKDIKFARRQVGRSRRFARILSKEKVTARRLARRRAKQALKTDRERGRTERILTLWDLI